MSAARRRHFALRGFDNLIGDRAQMKGGARGPFSDWSKWCRTCEAEIRRLEEMDDVGGLVTAKSSATFAEPERFLPASNLKGCAFETT